MLTSLIVVALGNLIGSSMAQLHRCTQGNNCLLPDCFCPTIKHPDFADTKSIPQMVYFGFDDALNVPVDRYYSKLFTANRHNPNGCPISMSLYVQNGDTSYELVSRYYQKGFEIGSHSVTHTMIDTAEKLRTEAGEQKDNLSQKGNVPLDQVVGWRSPNLQTAGDVQPDVLKELGYTYDISLTYPIRSLGAEHPWPYTLDFGYPYSCSIPPCPGATSSHPGFWEIPINSMFDKITGYPCVYVDACRPGTEAEALEFLMSNFEGVYNGNRAPFGLNMHAAWFFTADYLNAMQSFIEFLLTKDDVYIVSAKQVLDWMRTPYNVTELNKLPSWGCPNPKPRVPSQQRLTTQGPTTQRTPVRTFGPITLPPTPQTPRPIPFTLRPPVLITYSRNPVYNPIRLFPQIPTTKLAGQNGDQVPGGPNTSTRRSDTCTQGVTCNLPSCLCKSPSPPGNLPVESTPQIVYLTITGKLDGVSFEPILNLLSSRVNPNGCPISATFFVPVNGNYVPYVQSMRSRGHELSMYGSEARVYSEQLPLVEQIATELAEFRSHESNMGLRQRPGGVDHGFRSGSVNTLGEDLFKALHSANIEYDSSLVTSRRVTSNDAPEWPYTLDYGWLSCPTGQTCPQERYKGLWEVPIVPLVDYKEEFTCSYADACRDHPPTSEDTFHYFMNNFNRTLTTNRAPMGINLRMEWFSHAFYNPNLRGLELFLDTLLKTRTDVYMVSVEKMLDWIRNPTGLDKIQSFDPWSCK